MAKAGTSSPSKSRADPCRTRKFVNLNQKVEMVAHPLVPTPIPFAFFWLCFLSSD